jgi:entericidin A
MKLLTLILSTLVFLAGCNTISGVGKDIQKAGESIEEAAKKK